MQIYFVRHGKTEWNLEQRFQGAHGDSPLLPQSWADITKLGGYLARTEFTAIYTSPLRRAFDTAQGLKVSLGTQLPIIAAASLREFDLGRMEGLTFDEACVEYPQQVHDLWQAPDEYDGQAIGGEDYSEVIARGCKFGRAVAQRYPGSEDKVLAVSHGAALSAIMGGLLAYPLKDIRCNGGLSNTSLTILETNDQGASFRLVIWNETSFLDRKMEGTDSL
ncbi:histidine phosphatase family protein [Lactobacillus xylocopicola]|uniref:Phosphoglycerate mutase n=1 Tax=Lactobacillus xylocopicola TaxID=2976676 RepID=A0ABN6SLW0_9LACO|nr:histidine phosphatase family protein [Lactobacillus xylocopicola]BDR60414.1 phosphoglycerate mutase [Lactobacillus xylocopicola]